MPGTMPTQMTRRLPASSSLLLDVVRFGASVMVAVGHVTQGHFSTGWPDLTTHAVESVAIFFVLSGFVIRYVTRLKYARIGEYWIDRASRIYSVVLPAVLFTLLADWIAQRANPAYYLAHWGMYMDHPVERLVQNLLFTSQFWTRSTALFSNGPFWSLSYECLYYAIYGCAFYLRGARRWGLVLGLIVLGGAHIALLFPLWVLGCVLYEVYERIAARQRGWRTHLSFAVIGAAGVLLWQPAIAALFAVKQRMTLFFWAHHHQPPNLHWMRDYYRVGIPAAFLMLWLLVVVDGLRWNARSRWARSVRVLAEGTFPLYVVHFPLYVLIAAVIPYDHANPVAKIAMLLSAIAFGVLLAFPTNRLKDVMRNGLRRWFMPEDRMPAARSAETMAS
ncbi:MAG TPA: acyltransferase [Acidobacteriaceae bacterium]|jgi:peptidoglycan/LPS O-acetylase OafA/YrhL